MIQNIKTYINNKYPDRISKCNAISKILRKLWLISFIKKTKFPFHPSWRTGHLGNLLHHKDRVEKIDLQIFFSLFLSEKKRYDLYHTVNFLILMKSDVLFEEVIFA